MSNSVWPRRLQPTMLTKSKIKKVKSVWRFYFIRHIQNIISTYQYIKNYRDILCCFLEAKSLKYSVYFSYCHLKVKLTTFQVLNTCMWLEATVLGREALKSNWVELEAAWSWANYLSIMPLSIYICEMGLILGSTLLGL